MRIHKMHVETYKKQKNLLNKRIYKLENEIYYTTLGLRAGDNPKISNKILKNLNKKLTQARKKEDELVFNTILIK